MARVLLAVMTAIALSVGFVQCSGDDEGEDVAVDRAITGIWYQLAASGGNYLLVRNPLDSSLNKMEITQTSMAYNNTIMFASDSGFFADGDSLGYAIPGRPRWTQYYYNVVPVVSKGNALCLLHAQWGAVTMPAGGVTLENATDRYCRAADTSNWKQ